MKRVLIFTYYFPPANESASRRLGCFAKYLPEFGWSPSVVCHEWNESNCDYDPALLSGIDPASILASIPGERDGGMALAFSGDLSPKVQKILHPKRYPAHWTRNVEDRFAAICDAGPFDVAVGSCGPASSLFLARRAARRLGIPWVADFRDLSGQAGIPKSWKQALITLRLRGAERRLARDAAIATTTTEGQVSLIRRWYGGPVHVIRNGFDPADFDRLETKQPSTKFRIVHAGTLYAHRSPQPFLKAISNLVSKGGIAVGDVSFELYGEPEGSTFLSSLLSGFEHPEIVCAIPKVAAEECRKAFRDASLLMLPGEAGQVTVGAKLYEYIASGTPTVVGPPAHPAARTIIGETGAGFIAESQEELETILLRCYTEWKKSGIVSSRIDEAAVSRYSRREQTRELARMLNSVTS